MPLFLVRRVLLLYLSLVTEAAQGLFILFAKRSKSFPFLAPLCHPLIITFHCTKRDVPIRFRDWSSHKDPLYTIDSHVLLQFLIFLSNLFFLITAYPEEFWLASSALSPVGWSFDDSLLFSLFGSLGSGSERSDFHARLWSLPPIYLKEPCFLLELPGS